MPAAARSAARCARAPLSLAAVACGDDEPGSAAAPTTTAPQASEAFPVQIAHRYGTTTIESEPKRIVSVGLNEQDALWALGVAPVGVTDWMGYAHGIGPWAKGAAAKAGAPPELLKNTDGIQYERIAALRPDVIVALYSDLEKADYDKLAQIAPVVAAPEGTGDWGISWQDTTEILGEVTGRRQQAEEVISTLDARIAKEKADHPEFAGRTASMAMAYEGIWVYGASDPRSRLLTSLGFRLSPQIVKLVGPTYSKQISGERADLLDLDVVAWIGAKADIAELEKDRTYTQLPVHEEDRDFFIEQERPDGAMNAIGFQSPLSIDESLDVLVPALSAAVDGDPSTVPLDATSPSAAMPSPIHREVTGRTR